jgi:hypothetical protein
MEQNVRKPRLLSCRRLFSPRALQSPSTSAGLVEERSSRRPLELSPTRVHHPTIQPQRRWRKSRRTFITKSSRVVESYTKNPITAHTRASLQHPNEEKPRSTYLGMMVSVNSLGLRTRKALPCGNHETISVASVPSTDRSISWSFSGKGCVTPPVFFLI